MDTKVVISVPPTVTKTEFQTDVSICISYVNKNLYASKLHFIGMSVKPIFPKVNSSEKEVESTYMYGMTKMSVNKVKTV